MSPSLAQPLQTETERAFWLLFAAIHECHLNATEGAKLCGVTRETWYAWIGRRSVPRSTYTVRLRHANKLLRAALAEKSLPVLTGNARRAIVAELCAKLDALGSEE